MVGIPTPPERGCGQLSYERLGCSYVGNREDSHPMCRVIGIIHVQDMHDHSIYDLGLAICLGVEGHGFIEIGVQQ
jgi:hypothetical protein